MFINQIFFTGNIKNYGVGYPNKVDIYNTFASKQNVSLNRYFEQGASDPNISHGSWFVGGPQLDTLGGDTYPSFNPLTHGFTAYNNSTAGGQGRSITVDASQVTSNQLKDTSWETFYNEDHTSKGVGYSYGPNVSSDNLNLRYVPGGLHHPGWRNKFDGTPEPFIIAPIGDRKGEKTGAQGLKNTTWSNEFQGGYALEDASRLTKFYYETTAGAAHLVKQNILGLNTGGPKGGQRYQQVFYTGLSQILNAGGRFFGGRMYSNSQMGKGLADRTMPFNYIPLGLKGFGKGKDLNWYGKYEDGRDPGKPIVTEYPAKIGTSVNDDYLKSKGGKNSATTKPDTGRQQGMPMWFYDLRSGKYLTFRAYLEGLTENVSPNWNNDTYIGRSEPTYVYERTERDISFTLKLFNEIDGRIKVMYQKLGHLTSLCYPEYLKDTYLGNNKTRMKPPLVRMRMGELYGSDKNKGLLGFIKSISYAYPDESPWNLEVDDNSSIGNARVPQYVTAAITFQVIHDQLPNKSLPFNGIEELMGVANR